MRADIAAKFIYSHLLKAIKDNEQGTIADTDSEFRMISGLRSAEPAQNLASLKAYYRKK